MTIFYFSASISRKPNVVSSSNLIHMYNLIRTLLGEIDIGCLTIRP